MANTVAGEVRGGATPAVTTGDTNGDRRRKPRPVSRRRLLVIVLRIGLIAGFLLLWQFGAGTPGEGFVLIDEFYVSRPSEIWAAITDWHTEGVLLDSVLDTAMITVLGFLLGAALGLPVGLLLGVNRFISDVAQPFVSALNSIPRLALVPLFLLWFGLGITSKLVFVASIVSFLIFYNTYYGVRDVDPQLIHIARIMRASRWQLHAKITIPSATTWIIAGLRISVSYALIAAVTAEIISSNSGMGYLITVSAGQFYTAGVFGGILVLMVMSLVLVLVVTLLERRLLRWKPDTLASKEI